MDVGTIVLIVLGVLVGVPAAIALVVFLFVPVAKGLVWLVVHIAKFIGREIADVLRILGSILMMVVLAPLSLANLILLRRSAAAHYWEAIEREGAALLAAAYRVVIGNPARLLMLTPLTEGLEQRLPQVVQLAPTADRPGQRVGQFEGYTIVGSLPGGGSGSKLYIAKPTPKKMAAFSRAGIAAVDQVVIKSFSLLDGSSLPQIVRENRALPAAKRLGLILEHEVHDDRFFYVTKYVPGETLGIVTTRMHNVSGPAGLDDTRLAEAIDYSADLVRTLHHYHQNGLWHKDVKPDNVVISGGQAHLVDFGLITPLRSSITLTTHGTEYFRDPEMVRMALRGARVHEVDGCRFDIYAAGAVLYSMIENSFPAHGGLSRISKRCPEALRWIVRRAMADYDKRYASAADLLADIEAVESAHDPFAVRPADLPSVKNGGGAASMGAALGPDENEVGGPSIGTAAPAGAWGDVSTVAAAFGTTAAGSAAATTTGSGADAAARPRVVPRLRVVGWWTGRYEADPEFLAEVAAMSAASVVPGAEIAAELARVRAAAREAKRKAAARLDAYRRGGGASRLVPWAVGAFVVLALSGLVAYAVMAPRMWRNSGMTAEPQLLTQPSSASGPVEAKRVDRFVPPAGLQAPKPPAAPAQKQPIPID